MSKVHEKSRMSLLEQGSAIESNALLKDLHEKKQNLRRIASEVGSMASELRDVRGRMATQESTLDQETSRRQIAEAKVRSLQKEIETLRKSLGERSSHAISTASVAEQVDPHSQGWASDFTFVQYLRELVDLRTKLGSVQEGADASSASAVTAQLQCESLLKEIEKKNQALQDRDAHTSKLGQHIIELQDEIRQKEASQKQLQGEVESLKVEMKMAIAKVSSQKDSELRRSLDEASSRNAELLGKHLSAKDEELALLKEELRSISAQLKLKNQQLEAQVEKHRAADQDLKKRIIKLEFWLQEARAQTRKLQRLAEKREKELKDLHVRLANSDGTSKQASGFWSSSGFKIVVSLSVVVLFFFAKR